MCVSCVCVFAPCHVVSNHHPSSVRVVYIYSVKKKKKNKCVCVQFNVIPLSAIENCPSVARICVLILYTHTHVLSSTAKLHIYQSTTRTHTYTYSYTHSTEKTLSSATYVFIKNSANGPETAISICNAVNNIPPGRRVALSNDLPPLETKLVLRIIAITFLGPFRSTWGRFFALILSHSSLRRPAPRRQWRRRRGTMVANRWRIRCILH